METRRKVTDIERIARIFNLRVDEDNLLLKVQDIVKAKDSEINKKKFSNVMLKAQNDKLQAEIHNLKNEFADSVGLTEHMMVKQSRDEMRNQLNKALEENHILRSIVEGYKKVDFNIKLNKIVNG